MRVFVPATMSSLRALHTTRTLPVPLAYAVTSGLRTAYRDEADDDEIEFVALAYAARASLDALAADPAAVPRRVVIAADVADGVDSSDATGALPLRVPISIDDVVSIHVDDTDAETPVAAAIRARRSSGEWPDPAELDDLALMWFAPQEIEILLGP
jgi:hypothetical protein